MPLIATEGESKPRVQCPAGTHVARCISVIDLGTQRLNYMGQDKDLRKIRITWETPDEQAVFKEENGEQPFVLSKEYTLSLFEKANLRHDLEAWRGKAFTKEELKGFDIFNLLNVPCLLGVIHKPSKDGSKVYANVSAISKLAKGMTCPDAINPLVKYSVDDGRNETFESLPDWLKEKIINCREWTEGEPTTPEREVDGEDDNDPEIPF